MPYRVGIVGTDNSHALIFSQIANGVDQANYVPGFEVTHLFGLDSKRNQEVAEKGRVSNIVSKPSEMLGKIDIAFVEFRHGGLHLKYAKPFIEKGIPVFVDKPLAASTRDARQLLQLAKKKRILFTSFSTLRFAGVVQEFKNLFAAEQPIYLSVLGPGDLKSEYGGLIFYGIHPAEILNEIVGQGVKEVMAVRKDRNISVALLHSKLVGNIRISPDIPYLFSIEAVTRKSVLTKKADTTTVYRDGMIKLK
ncbi:MAG TPA: Gfo/Idh/MocA family oxidoreductase, partial [Thermoproteota archaeon]|nr:Gfo/Idh/MocA family oxidoreductase [Thermoproteota archaeon]